MGFAWHKLVPKKELIQCPPPCDFTYETSYSDTTFPITICPPFDPFNPNPGGVQACANFPGMTAVYGGAACGDKEVLEFTFRLNPGGPLEMRLNVPFTCSGNNDPNFGAIRPVEGNLNGCEMGTVSISQQYYYYRTPNSPSATPTQIASTKLCLKYNPFTVADRFMIISARNRYKYGGWHVDPSCPTAGDANTFGPPILWDDPSPDIAFPSGCGIKQFEQALGRPWPLANSVLNLPLFGATEAPLSTSQPTGKCGDGACDNGECFAVTQNDGTGHFGVQTAGLSGSGKGYYSFQCFNPMGYTTAWVQGSVYEEKPKSIPTCSIWSFVHAIWSRSWKAGWYSDEQAFPNQSEEINGAGQGPNPVYAPYAALLQADPSGLTNVDQNGGESNVTAYLRALQEGMEAHQVSQSVIMPNVFLWDRDAYITENTNSNKWKHIYFIGNANVIFDTQCMVGTFNVADPTPNYSQQDEYGFVIHLDEVAHDPAYGTSGNARLFGFYGCDPENPSNLSSKTNFGLKTMDCALTLGSPKGGANNYCEECANVDSGLGQIGGNTLNKCYHIGHQEDCSLQDGVQGL